MKFPNYRTLLIPDALPETDLYVVAVDSILLFFPDFITLALFVPEAITEWIQGIATLIFAVFGRVFFSCIPILQFNP